MNNLPRHIVGVFVMALSTLLIAALFFVEMPEGNREIALVVLGMVIGWGGTVVGFHYGSSEGSKEKTHMLSEKPIDGDEQ